MNLKTCLCTLVQSFSICLQFECFMIELMRIEDIEHGQQICKNHSIQELKFFSL